MNISRSFESSEDSYKIAKTVIVPGNLPEAISNLTISSVKFILQKYMGMIMKCQ